MISLSCSKCGESITVSDFHKGQLVRCNSCGTKNYVPHNAQTIDPTQSSSYTEANSDSQQNSDRTLVENRIRGNIVPTTRRFGIICTLIAAFGTFAYGPIGIILFLPVLLLGIGSVSATCTLLEGFGEIIYLLRRISKRC